MNENKFVFDLMDKHAPLTEEQLKTATTEEIVLHNLRFAYTQAQKYASVYPGLTNDEIIEGMFYGATLAANKWDPEKSKITSYIDQWIRTIIKDIANSNKHAIGRNTMHIWKSHVISKYVGEFRDAHDREPTIAEIKAGIDEQQGKDKFSEKTIYNIYKLGIKSVSSFNIASTDGEHDLHEVISNPDAPTPYDEANTSDLSFIVTRIIAGLSPLEQEVINRRWYDNHKYKEIAVDLDIPYPKVKKLEEQAMVKLKVELDAIEKR